MMKTMRAAVVAAPGVLQVQEVPVPEMSEYAVLCRNLYGATCTATDRHIIEQKDMFLLRLPTLLGHETVGRIVVAGKKVRHFQPGQRVARTLIPATAALNSNWGGFAEYGLAYDWRAMQEDGVEEKAWRDLLKNQVIPEDISDRAAPMLTTWRETHSYILRMGLRPGMRVLVIGSGGNGLSFAAHARWEGASAVLVGSAGREETARACGAEDFVSYRDPDCAGKLRELAQDGAFDLLVDAVGNEAQTRLALPCLKKGAVVGVYGIEAPVRLPEGDYTRYEGGYVEGETHERVIEGVRAGAYRAELFYDMEHPYALDDIDEAFRMLQTKAWPKALISLGGAEEA